MRKLPRLSGYDYSLNGAYFITICTYNRKQLFGNIIENGIVLSEYGDIVRDAILDLPNHNNHIAVDNFAIMPNHIHMIISICRERFLTVPNATVHGIPEIIRQLKTFSSKRINELKKRNGCDPFPTNTIWQKSYYDHIIRDEAEYLKIWQYIDENPARWSEDKYYI